MNKNMLIPPRFYCYTMAVFAAFACIWFGAEGSGSAQGWTNVGGFFLFLCLSIIMRIADKESKKIRHENAQLQALIVAQILNARE